LIEKDPSKMQFERKHCKPEYIAHLKSKFNLFQLFIARSIINVNALFIFRDGQLFAAPWLPDGKGVIFEELQAMP
jgi:hypothetical protein